MESIIGQLTAIHRYPVKSFAGERLETCEMTPQGLSGDRVCAFLDRTKEGWNSFVTARDIPNMLAYHAAFHEDHVSVLSPDGERLGWDGRLLERIQAHSKKKIAMSRFKEAHPENDQLLSVDAASILILSDATLRNIQAVWGKELNPLRFRPNLIIHLSDGEDERQLIGKQLRIGDVLLEVTEACERCSLITIDPITLERDPSLLRTVHERFQLEAGVYASVMKSGVIASGDSIRVVQ